MSGERTLRDAGRFLQEFGRNGTKGKKNLEEMEPRCFEEIACLREKH